MSDDTDVVSGHQVKAELNLSDSRLSLYASSVTGRQYNRNIHI